MDVTLPRAVGALLDPLAFTAILGSLAFLYMLWHFIVDDIDPRGEGAAPAGPEGVPDPGPHA